MIDPTASSSGPNWPSPPGGGGIMGFIAQMLSSSFGMMLGQFNPTQNIQDTQEAQRFTAMRYGASMYAASNSNAQQQVAQVMQQFGFTGSALSTGTIGAAVNNILPIAQQFGGGLFDAVGLSAPMYTGAIAMSQRDLLQGQDYNPAAMGNRLGRIGAAAYNQLYDPTAANPLQNTYGFGGSQAGLLVAAGIQKGWFNTNLTQGDEAAGANALAGFTRRVTGLASSVRDISGIDPRFAGLNEQQLLAMSDSLTLGGTGMSLEERGKHIRNMTALTRMNDMRFEDVQGLQIQAGQYAQMIGGRQVEGTVAGNRALAERAYYKGLGNLDENVGSSLAELTQKAGMLTANAINSQAGAQMAALMEIAADPEKYGAKLTDENGQPTELGKQVQNLKEGKYSYQQGEDFQNMLARGGMESKSIQGVIGSRRANLEKHGMAIANNARDAQWDADLAPNIKADVSGMLSGASKGRFKGKKLDDYADAVANALRTNGGKSSAEVLAAVKAALIKAGMPEEDVDRYASLAIEASDETAQAFGYKSAREAATLHSDAMKGAAKQNNATATEAAIKADKSAADQQMNPWQRAYEGFKQGGIPGALKGFFFNPKEDPAGKSGRADTAVNTQHERPAGPVSGVDNGCTGVSAIA